MLIVQDDRQANVALEAGELSCSCGGQLRPWGYTAPRVVRHRGGVQEHRRWRRGRCVGCGTTHVLAYGVVPRRRDDVSSIGSALLCAGIDGVGHRPIAAELAVPASTVRGWLRRARAGAAWIGAQAMRWAHRLDPNLWRRGLLAGPLGEAVAALGLAASTAALALGPGLDPWRLAVRFTDGRLLSAPSG